jgi:DNA-binding SARP family transcriptional activator
MRFGILGPLEVWDGQRRVALGGPQQRALLAALLLQANRVVSVDRLVDRLWGEDPPAAARSLLQGCVAQLRRSLRAGGAGRPPLVTRAPGYLIEVGPGELDLDRFEELAAAAARALAGGAATDVSRAGALLREALSVWRGPALADLPTDRLRAEVAALAERRLSVLEDRIDIDLRREQFPELAGELPELVRRHPRRERLWAQLMLALAGAGRRADALAAYQELRQNLVEQLGVEPGSTVRQLQRAILAGTDPLPGYLAARPGPVVADPGPAAPPAAAIPPPAQLPAAPAVFTGRARALKRLDELLVETDQQLPVGVVCGTAGVGKTALAVRWAHQVRDRFGDGQLYADLRGYGPAPPARPVEVLAGFLAALGVPAREIPADPRAAAAQFRTRLAGRRMLVLLDNAGSAEQVRPLLPGTGGCLALVTSRDRLGGLVAREGAVHIGLERLDPADATALLGRVLGQRRAGAEPAATAELAGRCAYLPLALRIAAANLLADPGRRIAEQVAELATGDRLAALEVDGDAGSAVRAAFDHSYATLPPDARRMFRLLGLVPGPDLTAGAAAALAGTSPELAARQLERLAGGHLLEQPAAGRYACHDLLRQYAAERARDTDPPEQRAAATARLLDWYLRSADRAARLLYPERLRLPVPPAGHPPAVPPTPPAVAAPPTAPAVAAAAAPASVAAPAAALDDHQQALAWLDAERPNLVAAVQAAAPTDRAQPVLWQLADTLTGYFDLRSRPVDWLAVAGAGLAAAAAGGDLPGQAVLQVSLGDRHERQGDYRSAATRYTSGLALSRDAGWLPAQAAALAKLGILHRRAGRLPEAADHFARALELDRQAGWLPGIAARLGSLGNLHAELGQLETAAGYYARALPIHQEIGSRHGEAVVSANFGECCLVLGRLDQAIDHFGHALALNHEMGDRAPEGDNHRALATAHRDAGRPAAALELARTAVRLARETGARRFETDARNALGTIYRCLGEHDRALEQHQRALQLARTTGTRQHEVDALIGLADVHPRLGQPDRALGCAEQAVSLARRFGYRLLEGPALAALAAAQLERVQGTDEAIRYAQLAIESDRAVGYRLGEARARLLLGHAYHRRGDAAAAATHWRQALARFTDLGAPEADQVRALLPGAGVATQT